MSSSEYIGTLRRLALLNDLSDVELALFVEGMSRLCFEKGSVIFAEGNACHELLIVEEGEIKILKSAANGRQQLLSVERWGSALAEVAVFDGGCYPVTAEATTPAALLRLPADSFRKTCVNNPAAFRPW